MLHAKYGNNSTLSTLRNLADGGAGPRTAAGDLSVLLYFF